jgi:hypothetical protein
MFTKSRKTILNSHITRCREIEERGTTIMFGDVTTHDRFEGIRGACAYLAKKRKGRLNHWGEGRYEFKAGMDICLIFTAKNWLYADIFLKV